MENPFADVLKNLKQRNHRKLSFEEQCAFYAALKCAVPPLAVSRAAGVSPIAISHLARAGSFLGGQIRYPKVIREYETLGHDAFINRYLTPPLRERIDHAIDAFAKRKRDPDLNAKGYNPRANGNCGRYEWPETSIGLHAIFRIELYPDGAGYFWRNLKPFYDQAEIAPDQVGYHPACHLWGDPSRGPERGPGAKGFATSQLCFRHVKRLMNPSAAQMAETAQ